MRVALVHDWLVAQRGGEQVLLELCRLFPAAPIYTLVHVPKSVDPEIERHPIRTSFVQHLPGAPQRFRQYLPLFPMAAESWDLSTFDLIVSTSHCVAKGVRVAVGQRHVAYIHTPMRYLWDQLPEYLPSWPGRRLWESAARLAAWPLRQWDRKSAGRPTRLIANSEYVAQRIARVWGRAARVLYPPVNVSFYAEAPEMSRQGYLVVSALVPYKRTDLAVRLATERDLPLRVVGDGPQRQRLQRIAGPSVEFIVPMGPADLRVEYARARALIFCGVEDFGIVPVEAMAAGCPVIALGKGGASESVKGDGPERTGVFFSRPTLESLARGIIRFERLAGSGAFSREALAMRARLFDRATFIEGFKDILARTLAGAPFA